MTSELFTLEGKRKYLTAEEQGRFIAAANAARLEKRENIVRLAFALSINQLLVAPMIGLPSNDQL